MELREDVGEHESQSDHWVVVENQENPQYENHSLLPNAAVELHLLDLPGVKCKCNRRRDHEEITKKQNVDREVFIDDGAFELEVREYFEMGQVDFLPKFENQEIVPIVNLPNQKDSLRLTNLFAFFTRDSQLMALRTLYFQQRVRCLVVVLVVFVNRVVELHEELGFEVVLVFQNGNDFQMHKPIQLHDPGNDCLPLESGRRVQNRAVSGRPVRKVAGSRSVGAVQRDV